MSVRGECKAGNDVEAVATYFGGVQGDSQYQWFRTAPEVRSQ